MAQPDLSLADTLVRNATWFADTPAYVADGRAQTHAQLLARAGRLASALAAAGVRRVASRRWRRRPPGWRRWQPSDGTPLTRANPRFR
jgi:acyl-CoA synthetase (AMP-forming)/AMP-acid ligase II